MAITENQLILIAALFAVSMLALGPVLSAIDLFPQIQEVEAKNDKIKDKPRPYCPPKGC
jgi:hypothetical protein